jgi:hypothetical protein
MQDGISEIFVNKQCSTGCYNTTLWRVRLFCKRQSSLGAPTEFHSPSCVPLHHVRKAALSGIKNQH